MLNIVIQHQSALGSPNALEFLRTVQKAPALTLATPSLSRCCLRPSTSIPCGQTTSASILAKLTNCFTKGVRKRDLPV
jgi:hypothetical protein